MANWRLGKSLEQLRKQVNAASPKRSKVSDGSIGDTSHQGRGSASDHNPNAQGVVCAIDITHDPDHNVDGGDLSLALIEDPRVKYIIFSSQIWKARTGKWEPYRGPNKHRQHVHVSVNPESIDDVKKWPWPPVPVKFEEHTLNALPVPQTPPIEVSAEDTATPAAAKPDNPTPQNITLQPTVADNTTSKKSLKATLWAAPALIGTWAMTNIERLFGWVTGIKMPTIDPQTQRIVLISVAVIISLFILRQIIGKVISEVGAIVITLRSMKYHADPVTNNVRIASPAPREETQ